MTLSAMDLANQDELEAPILQLGSTNELYIWAK